MTRVYAWLAGLGAALLTLLGLMARERGKGKREAKQEAIVDGAKRVEKGRKAVANGRKHGSPDDRVQHNDTAW